MNSFKERLQRLKEEGPYRELRSFSGSAKTRMVYKGRELLLFSSNDYLGLSSHPNLKRAAIEAISLYGCGTGASRLVSGTSPLHEELEKKIASFKGTEAALVFNSGFTANTGLISAIAGKGSTIFCDKLNHASIIEGALLSRATLKRYPHGDMKALNNLLKASKKKSGKLITTDGLFSMDGDLAPLGELVELAKKHEALVMVDDAHGTGVFGKTGRGVAEYFGVSNKIDIHMGTFSKAVGSFGGFIACSRDLKDYLINKSRNFIYTTSLPPSVIAASIEGLNIIETEPDRRESLLRKALRIRTCLKEAGLDTMGSNSQIIPVYVGDDSLAMKASGLLMEEERIFIPAIRPPTVPKNRARLRISVAADHSDSEIDQLINALISTFKYLNVT